MLNMLTWLNMAKFNSKLELRRQLLHFIVTSTLALLIYLNFFDFYAVVVITFIGILISIFSKKFKIPIIKFFLNKFEREENMRNFPGRGVVLLFATTSLLLFFLEKNIVFLALVITAVGDSISPLFGIFLGKKKLFWNQSKHWEGFIASVLFSFLALICFVKPLTALIVSLITMGIETLSLKVFDREVDDNILVPLIAAILLAAAKYYSHSIVAGGLLVMS